MNPKLYFPNLDGLRTVACFMVFCFHALGMGHNRLQIHNELIETLLLTFLNGKTGVSIFFVLSGFLITFLILSEIQAKGKFNLGYFYIRRALRIWPLYFLVLIIVFVFLPLVDQIFKLHQTAVDTNPWYYFTFLSNFDVLQIFQMHLHDFLPTTITWSVAIEEQFYLFWPVLFIIIPRAGYKYIFPLLIIAALGFRLSHSDNAYQLYFHTFSAVFDLSIGGAAAWTCFKNSKVKQIIADLKDPGRLMIALAGLITMYINSLIHSRWIMVLLTAAQAVFFAYLIIDQCYNQSAKFKFSASRILTRLGKYTYGMYMLHPLVLLVINVIMVNLFHIPVESRYTIAACFLIGLPSTIGAAQLSYQLLEKKFLRLKENFTPIAAT